jgi:23S rRNA G2445 N2-methylase RlmL
MVSKDEQISRLTYRLGVPPLVQAPSMVMTNPPWGLRIASTKDDDSNEDNDSGHWADKEEPGSRGEVRASC